MKKTDTAHAGTAGDRIEVKGLPGRPARRGQIIEVRGAGEHTHYRVRWDELHESLLYPSEGAVIISAADRDQRGRKPWPRR